MNARMTSILTLLQSQIHARDGIRTDVYYTEGKGALFIREGADLRPDNVILAVPDLTLR
jgi:hypothetical protein